MLKAEIHTVKKRLLRLIKITNSAKYVAGIGILSGWFEEEYTEYYVMQIRLTRRM